MASRKNGGKPVAVTGFGVITSLGKGIEENWKSLLAGRSGIHAITRFPTDGLRTTIAGSVDYLGLERTIPPVLSHALAKAAIDEAMARAGWLHEDAFPGGLYLAAPPLEHDWQTRLELCHTLSAGPNSPYSLEGAQFQPNEDTSAAYRDFTFGNLAAKLAREYRTQGSPITLTTACASGASAIQLGVEAIRRGAKAALAVGTDGSIQEEALIRFSKLSALSTKNDPPEKASKPFSKNRDGFVMAEGGAALILEDPDFARARGAEIIAYVRGCGEATDTFHRTRSNPNGQAIMRTMQMAVDDAGIEPRDIGYINAHGTSTPENDKMENFGITEIFGDHARNGLAVSSNKSMIGHTLTAAGAVEASFSILTMIDEMLPPTINYDVPDPNLELDIVPNEARKASPEFVLSNSFGFGGQNVSLVLSREAN
ncbi:MAG: beta-ketoacyl synthase N-terminal-like domain-containing protein [Alphaproteobacteria bacterium]